MLTARSHASIPTSQHHVPNWSPCTAHERGYSSCHTPSNAHGCAPLADAEFTQYQAFPLPLLQAWQEPTAWLLWWPWHPLRPGVPPLHPLLWRSMQQRVLPVHQQLPSHLHQRRQQRQQPAVSAARGPGNLLQHLHRSYPGSSRPHQGGEPGDIHQSNVSVKFDSSKRPRGFENNTGHGLPPTD